MKNVSVPSLKYQMMYFSITPNCVCVVCIQRPIKDYTIFLLDASHDAYCRSIGYTLLWDEKYSRNGPAHAVTSTACQELKS